MNKNIENHISGIQELIRGGATLTDATASYFENIADTDIQKIILRELSEIYKDQTEELKKLYPWNPEIFTRDVTDFEQYFKTYKPENGYICNVFATSNFDDGKLVFDRGTMNFIGARTSRGKTTAMVSMTVDALLNDKKVVFATFEETDRQIITRIVLNLAWRKISADKRFDEDGGAVENKDLWNGSYSVRDEIREVAFSPAKIFQSFVRNNWEKPDYNPFEKNQFPVKSMEVLKSALKQGYVEAQKFLLEGRLMIFNGYLADFRSYLDALVNIERGSVVFADYIQKIPTPGRDTRNRYESIKRMLREIDAAVKKNGLISINGAQFGRTDNKTNPKIKDSFTDEAFQESSDIEQIGEIEIGIGREPAKEDEKKGNRKERMFFSVLKNRNGKNDPAMEYDLIDGRKFSFYAAKYKDKRTLLEGER